MKKHTTFIYTLALSGMLALDSCVNDLNVTPIDPNMETPDKVLTDENSYKQVLAKCYAGLAVSATGGPDSDPDISGIDGGFGQYLRALFYMNELTTDEAVVGWNDQTVQDLHGLAWTSSDIFVSAMYGRLFYQISVCNEFLRQAKASGINTENMKTYIAEARALRALSYYHAIDMFGNVPFCLETDAIGGTSPRQISRADLWDWLITEIKNFMPDLKPALGNEYGRIDQGAANMILAKLYLNAEVYTGTPKYEECAKICLELTQAGYDLEDNYEYLFMADNDLCTRTEIIFTVEQDGINTQTYGGGNNLVFGATGGSMPGMELMGIGTGWGGYRTTPEFVDLFEEGDKRALFYTSGQSKTISDLGNFNDGYAITKFKNKKRDGSNGKASGFVDTDVPIFRYADVYLMLAECSLRGATSVTKGQGLEYLNLVRDRAKIGRIGSDKFTLDEVLNERGRELYWECFRRSDLIRFGKFTTDTYVWSWKGGTATGKSVDAKYNIFPLASSDINSNGNLVQNPGY